MPKYIGLSGYARSGKDTVASMLGDHGFVRYAFADKLKEAVARLNPIIHVEDGYGYTLEQLLEADGQEYVKENYPEYRRLLQVMGTEVGRQMFGENIWVDIALKQVPDNGLAVFTDCRFPNEAQAIHDLGGQVWRIDRPGYGPINGHISETAIDDFDFDVRIDNSSNLAHLKEEVLEALLDMQLADMGLGGPKRSVNTST